MWCDNCCLILPLRAGGMVWSAIIFVYSVVGGVFLFRWGQFIYFVFPEWYIYGGIALAVALTALINLLCMSNRSLLWTQVARALWPFMLVISLIRAIFMIFELQRGKDKLAWECANGGQLWGATPLQLETQTVTMPVVLCVTPFQTIFTVFTLSLLADLVFQMYMLFLNWRFHELFDNYQEFSGPAPGGYYYGWKPPY